MQIEELMERTACLQSENADPWTVRVVASRTFEEVIWTRVWVGELQEHVFPEIN